jgi:hypothetical protein
MTPTALVYRGVRYDADHSAQAPASAPVRHIYRGIAFQEPLGHEPAKPNETVVLHYRGNVYQHRQQEAARQIQDR